MAARKILVVGFFLLAVGIPAFLIVETAHYTYWHVNILKILLEMILYPVLAAGLMFVTFGLIEWKFPKKNANQ